MLCVERCPTVRVVPGLATGTRAEIPGPVTRLCFEPALHSAFPLPCSALSDFVAYQAVSSPISYSASCKLNPTHKPLNASRRQKIGGRVGLVRGKVIRACKVVLYSREGFGNNYLVLTVLPFAICLSQCATASSVSWLLYQGFTTSRRT